eukprot:TRINITY_DN1270_c0_g1_i1.p1 TRINITY_DN1270_c0_g1~~TRINITY_DN1270_c0_g1_i1.p1  ORF type:complete len:207 (+),score=44.99 TRINITY_DN1270_c0_g1_i1:72-623(+)
MSIPNTIRTFCVTHMWLLFGISALGFGISTVISHMFEEKTGGVLGLLDLQEMEVPYDNNRLSYWFELYGHEGKVHHVMYTLAIDTFIILTFYPWLLSLLAYAGWDTICFVAVLPMIADIFENSNILFNISQGPTTAVFQGYCTVAKFGLAIPIGLIGVIAASVHKCKSHPNNEVKAKILEDDN